MKKTLSSKGVFKVQLFKRIGATVFVVIILFTIAAPCFSTPVAIEGIDIFTALYNAYLVARGMDAVGSSNDVPWTVSEPASSATWRDLWQQNFDYYASQVDQTITDVDAWLSAYIDQLDAQIRDRLNPSEPPEDPNDNGVIGLQFTAQLTEFFDKFTNLIFKDKYNLTNDGSGFVHSSGSFDSSLSSTSVLSGIVIPMYYHFRDLDSLGVSIGYSSDGYEIRVGCWADNANAGTFGTGKFRIAVTLDNGNYVPVIIWNTSDLSGWSRFGQFTIGKYNNGNYVTSYSVNIDYPAYDNSVLSPYKSYIFNPNGEYIMNDSSLTVPIVDVGTNSSGVSSSTALHLSPSDRIGSSPIPVPDTDDVDYVPAPLDIPLNVPWSSTMHDPDFSDETDPAAEAIIDAITGEVATNTLTTLDPVTPEPPLASPSPVMPPFLPSEPPPFNFNFSGIWYYVVRWVNSMRSGMGWLMNIWSNIPAAMFYPVFGTAVVVIVLGVWRRFVA